MLKINKNKEETETHHFLPSGEWEGFYCYNKSSEQHKMEINLVFKRGIVSGNGTDDIAPYTWKGSYCLKTFKVSMIKRYATHQIKYNGDIDEQGIWGVWENIVQIPPGIDIALFERMKAGFRDTMIGGFHIWPKKTAANSEKNKAEEKLTASKKLKRLVKMSSLKETVISSI